MRTLINTLLIVAAMVVLVATVIGFKRHLASQQMNKKALAVVLENNAALKAQIDNPKPALSAAPVSQNEDEGIPAAFKIAMRTQGPWGVSETPAFQQERRKALEEHKLNDREFGLKYYAALRSEVDAHYGPFYRLQHLSKQQTDALAELLFQRQLRHDKADADKKAGGSDADLQTAKAGANAELAAAARETLGADLYGQFSLYERQRPAWDYVGNYGGMLSLVDIPLSLEQASRLADAIAMANTPFQNGEPVKVEWSGTAQDWSAVNAAAADFLTPKQLDFFKNIFIPAGNDDMTTQQEMELNNILNKSGYRGAVRTN